MTEPYNEGISIYDKKKSSFNIVSDGGDAKYLSVQQSTHTYVSESKIPLKYSAKNFVVNTERQGCF